VALKSVTGNLTKGIFPEYGIMIAIRPSLTIVLPAIAMLAVCNWRSTVHGENTSVADVAAATQDAVKLG